MNIKYEFIDNLREEEVREFLDRDDVKSHFLGSPEWAKVSEKRGATPYFVGMKKDDQLVATALLLKKNLFMGYCYFYCPRGFVMDYSDKELLKVFTEEIDKFCKKHKSIYFKIDPDIKLHTIDLEGNVVDGEENHDLVEYLTSIGYKHKGFNYFFENEQPRFTFRICLEDSMEEIESRYSRTTKTRIKHAQNSQVEVVKGTQEDIKEFTRLMAMTEKRQDFFSHDKEFYEYFYEIFAEHDKVTLYLGKVNVPKLIKKLETEYNQLKDESQNLVDATKKKEINRKKEIDKKLIAIDKQLKGLEDKPKEEVVVSSYLIVNYGDKAWALYAANDMDYGKFFANYGVYQRQIRDAHDAGLKVFDVFGTIGKPDSDSKLAGLYEFKKKWGGEYTEFIGEFDYVENKLMYFMYKTLIPHYHKMVNKRLRKKVQQNEG